MAGAEPKGKPAKFLALDAADKWLVVRATFWLLAARVMILMTPFEKLATRLSASADNEEKKVDPELLGRVGYAVAVAAAQVPWRSDCFPQTIAAHMLLKGKGISSVIHLGVERVGDSGLDGHAWLTCGDTVVIGGAELDRYTEVHRLK